MKNVATDPSGKKEEVYGSNPKGQAIFSVDEKDKSFTLKVEGSSFPNWNGTTQKRPFSISGDELKWNTPAASAGGSNDLVWKRIK